MSTAKNAEIAPDAPEDTLLPDGRTCDECEDFNRCEHLGFAAPGQVACDFSPSAFRPRGLAVLP